MKENILKIQKFLRNCLLKKRKKLLLSSKLFTVKSTSFYKLRKLQKDNKTVLYNFLDLFKLTLPQKRTIEMGMTLAIHPESMFGENENEWSQYEKNIIFFSNLLLANIINSLSYNKLYHFIKEYLLIFNEWKKYDYQQTIRGIIISYHYRQEHLDKVRNNEEMDNEQKLNSIKQLNQQISHLEQSLLMMDKNFDLDNLRKNHQKIFNQYVSIEKQTINTLSKAYLDFLIENCNNDEWTPLFNEIISTQNRLLELVPKKRKQSIKNKFDSYQDNISQISNQIWSEPLLEMFLFMIDLIINLDAPINDEKNQQWKIDTLSLVEKPFIEGISNLLININQKIDSIHLLIKNLN